MYEISFVADPSVFPQARYNYYIVLTVIAHRYRNKNHTVYIVCKKISSHNYVATLSSARGIGNWTVMPSEWGYPNITCLSVLMKFPTCVLVISTVLLQNLLKIYLQRMEIIECSHPFSGLSF